MQAAEMLCGTRAYVYHLVFLISLSIGYVYPFPLQVLPSIPGYIPVYIRHGDQPLEDINPALAEAFHEGPSLLKNIHLDDVHGPTDISLEEDEANKNNMEAIHVRQVDNNFSAEDEKSKEPTKITLETTASKRKTVSEPVVKITPLTEEEKEALETFRIKIEGKTKNSNDMRDSKSSELSSKKPHRKDNVRHFNPVVKIEEMIIDETNQPNLHLIMDVPQSSTNDGPAYTLTDEKLPIKEQHHPRILSNVHKLAASPEMSLQPEKQWTENQSLDEKSK